MDSEAIAHSAFGLTIWAIDSEPIRARGIIVKYTKYRSVSVMFDTFLYIYSYIFLEYGV